MTTTPEEFISIASQAKDLITPLITGAFILSMLFYARLRAGSSVFIRERVWRILGGRRSFYSKELQDAWQRLCDLEKFNYSTGIRLLSFDRTTELLSWIKEKEIHLEELARIRKHFNSSTFSITNPCLLRLKAISGAAMALIIFTTFAFAFSGSGALLKVKKTNTYLWVTNETVRALTSPSWVISQMECETTSPSALGHDKDVSCSAFSDEKSKQFVKETILSQQILASFLFIFSGILLISAMRDLTIGKQAAALYERTNRPVDITVTLPSDPTS